MDRERWPAYDSCNALFKRLKRKLNFKFKWGVIGDFAAVTYGSTRKAENLSIFIDHCEYLKADRVVRQINRESDQKVSIELFSLPVSCLLRDQYDSNRHAAGTKWPVISIEATVATQLSKMSVKSTFDVVEMICGECVIDWEQADRISQKLEVPEWLLSECRQIEEMMGCNQDPTKPKHMNFLRL
jgi:hypothetical protein